MENKRYSIVRVNNSCPEYMEDFKCHFPDISIECMSCHHHRYGDTKEQLAHKIAQVMLRRFVNLYLRNTIKPKLAEEQIEVVYKNYLEIAKEIVEFLGVEE